MYISKIRIQNFRCPNDVTVEFNPGINVINGENNAGRTALFKALGLFFDQSSGLTSGKVQQRHTLDS